MGESSLPITVVPETETGTIVRRRWFREEIAHSCVAWSIRANDDNDNHINDDNVGALTIVGTKYDFVADFNMIPIIPRLLLDNA